MFKKKIGVFLVSIMLVGVLVVGCGFNLGDLGDLSKVFVLGLILIGFFMEIIGEKF